MWRVGFYVLAIILVSVTGQSSRPCTTPNGEQAQCISIYSCSRFIGVTSPSASVTRFMRSSFCGVDSVGRPMVCCGSDIDYQANKVFPDRNNCGYQDSFKIVGGSDTEINEFPWTALLGNVNATTGMTQYDCGGTLISERYVLTAGHCVNPTKVTTIRLGEWNMETPKDCIEVSGVETCAEPLQNINVEEIVIHEAYWKGKGTLNDIALIRLAAPVTINDFVKPICLPLRTERSNVGRRLDVTGWGQRINGTSGQIKQKLQVPITNFANCQLLYRAQTVNVTDTQLCAGGEKGKDSCKGDSGGPLIARVEGGVNQYYIEGITSFGAICGIGGWPAIYTRVSEYLDWIDQHTRL